ncbi:hypothetical protein Rvan_1157 [Rhodomicrobium vannielii ATCC 17100]|jgi:hypothetical protein|uniref:DUF4145 domain-containing protein n=1 Tax=Rhodomicrobium vannielii (strain ATCC 17100 / DSM 162 / LMG 4299 / NCIMB 10020 / ATH 3.1.1) TaxID=648757 RepID=E3I4B3_RHOVT|nr:DUF4145 domain-containing protein [Rhodomicrobium vannielii]ADP70428.1 hypothetical protein Rvan_1157 [Rhodomicrobium vannielii ATCC 17100]
MTKQFVNDRIIKRFDELISEGYDRWEVFKNDRTGIVKDIVGFTQWSTSCLNLLDKLSISTNRFVSQFEVWAIGGPGRQVNIGAALGVLKSARHEYSCGLAIEYQLSISATVFSGLLDEAAYLLQKGYIRAAAVLLGAALEEGLKARARAVPIVLSPRDTLSPVIVKLKSPEVGLLTEFEAKRLEAIARLRNDAAHGGEFTYQKEVVETAIQEVEATLGRLLSAA